MKSKCIQITGTLVRGNPSRSDAFAGRGERVSDDVDSLVPPFRVSPYLGYSIGARGIHTCIFSCFVSDYRNVSKGISRNLG